MQTQTRLITLQAVTFLHPGTGQTTGVVDLPIQREIHTGHPMFAASGLKGSLRDKAEQLWGKNDADLNVVFGSSVSNEDKGTTAGALSVTDARILAFPVRSLQQVFVWVTCPMVIERLLRDVGLIGFPLDQVSLAAAIALKEADALVTTNSGITNPLILEELSFETDNTNAYVDKVAELIQKLVHISAGFEPKRLVIIADWEFQHLVRYATQVSARIKLNDQKTTTGDGGNLWYEETLPPETILYSLALCHTPRQGKESDNKITITDASGIAAKLDDLLKDHFLQIGGNETVGQGWCSVKVNAPNGNGELA